MSKVLITGSSDGLGLAAAQLLLAAGHEVVLHARNQGRARDAMTAAPNANGVLVGDLASIAETRGLADQANRWGCSMRSSTTQESVTGSAESRRSMVSSTSLPSMCSPLTCSRRS